MPSRRPALIFDFGNVVAYFDYQIACERLGRPIGLGGGRFLEVARQRGLTPILLGYERGDLSSEEFSENVCRLMGLDVGHDVFAASWADIFRLNESVAALIQTLRARDYTLVLGSNTNAIHADHFRRRFAETFAAFDRLILSYEVRHIKPSAEFYLACADAARASPEACVFIDDMPENVEGARAAGLMSILYQDTPQLVVDLRALGVDVGGEPDRGDRDGF